MINKLLRKISSKIGPFVAKRRGIFCMKLLGFPENYIRRFKETGECQSTDPLPPEIHELIGLMEEDGQFPYFATKQEGIPAENEEYDNLYVILTVYTDIISWIVKKLDLKKGGICACFHSIEQPITRVFFSPPLPIAGYEGDTVFHMIENLWRKRDAAYFRIAFESEVEWQTLTLLDKIYVFIARKFYGPNSTDSKEDSKEDGMIKKLCHRISDKILRFRQKRQALFWMKFLEVPSPFIEAFKKTGECQSTEPLPLEVQEEIRCIREYGENFPYLADSTKCPPRAEEEDDNLFVVFFIDSTPRQWKSDRKALIEKGEFYVYLHDIDAPEDDGKSEFETITLPPGYFSALPDYSE